MSEMAERILAARDAWQVAMATWTAGITPREASRREAIRLWLEYLELADPVCARKICRLMKYGEIDAEKTDDKLFPEAAVPLGRSIPRAKRQRFNAGKSRHAIALERRQGFRPGPK